MSGLNTYNHSPVVSETSRPTESAAFRPAVTSHTSPGERPSSSPSRWALCVSRTSPAAASSWILFRTLDSQRGMSVDDHSLIDYAYGYRGPSRSTALGQGEHFY